MILHPAPVPSFPSKKQPIVLPTPLLTPTPLLIPTPLLTTPTKTLTPETVGPNADKAIALAGGMFGGMVGGFGADIAAALDDGMADVEAISVAIPDPVVLPPASRSSWGSP
jgi:hypothetical protein